MKSPLFKLIFLIAILICFTIHIPDALAQSGGVKQSPAESGVIGGMMAFILVLVFLLITGILKLMTRASSSVAKSIKNKASSTISEYKVDSSFSAIAEKEVETESIDEGLWGKALVRAKRNELVRKAEYIKLRAKELQQQKK